MQQLKKINFKKQKGFSLIDSLLAVGVIGAVMYLGVQSDSYVNNAKQAKIYANQTKNYTNDFLGELYRVLDNNTRSDRLMLEKLLTSGLNARGNSFQEYPLLAYYYQSLVTSYNSGNKYPMMIIPLQNNTTKSITSQQPCLLLYYDNSANKNEMSGIIYYAGKGRTTQLSKNFVKQANSYYPNFLTYNANDGSIYSSTGWIPNQRIINYIKSNKCGNEVLNGNSLIVNLQTISGFNSRLYSTDVVQRTSDQKTGVFTTARNYFDPMKLPGGLANNNTLKSALNSSGDIILKKDTINGNTLLTRVNDSGYSSSTLQIGNSNNTDNNNAFLTSAIKPNKVVAAGTTCLQNELGKIAVTQADSNNSGRNLVACTQNEGVCTQGAYCYLPIKQNEFTFTNSNGVEDNVTRRFICPAYAPFLKSYSPNNFSNAKVNIFFNHGINISGDNYSNGAVVQIDYYQENKYAGYSATSVNVNNCKQSDRFSNVNTANFYLQPTTYSINNLVKFSTNNPNIFSPAYCKTFDTDNNYIAKNIAYSVNAGVSSITNGSDYSIKDLSGDIEVITKTNNEGITTPVGVKVRNSAPDCNSSCGVLNTTLGGGWSEATTLLADINITFRNLNPQTQCICAKREGNYLTGLAEIRTPSLSAIAATPITSVTCSTAPEYGF